MNRRVVFAILMMISLIIVPTVLSDSVWDYLTVGQGDNRYCQLYGDCIVSNLSIIGGVFNVTVENYNVTGSLHVDGNITADYFIGDGSLLTGIEAGDNLGNHNATKNLNINDLNISFNDNIVLTGPTITDFGGTRNVIIGEDTQKGGSDNVIIGHSAIGLGSDGISIGEGAHIDWAEDRSIAIGRYSYVDGDDSVAMGRSASVRSNQATAIGYNADVDTSSNFGVAIGTNSYVRDTQSIALGISAITSTNARDSVALGSYSYVDGDYSVAIGRDAKTGGQEAVAIGRNSSANASGAICIGTNCFNDDPNTVKIGSESIYMKYDEGLINASHYCFQNGTCISSWDQVGGGTEVNGSHIAPYYLYVDDDSYFDGEAYFDSNIDQLYWKETMVGRQFHVLRNSQSAEGLSLMVNGDGHQALMAVDTTVDRNLVFGGPGHIYWQRDFDHARQDNPTFWVHSVTDPNTDNSQWMSFTHNTTSGVIGTGKEQIDILTNVVSNGTICDSNGCIGDPGDSLGNHTAEQNLDLASNSVTNVDKYCNDDGNCHEIRRSVSDEVQTIRFKFGYS